MKVYSCSICETKNYELRKIISNRFGYGKTYSFLCSLLLSMSYWEKWDDCKKHLVTKHKLKSEDINKPLFCHY